jgi:hypothetical protein
MADTDYNPFAGIEPARPRQVQVEPRNIPQRYNNPGNLRDPVTKQFKYFNTTQEGWRALREDLSAKMTGKTKTGLTPNSTLYEFAQIYAPDKDRNDPKAYAEFIAGELKVKTDTPIGRLGDKVDQFAKVVATKEGFFDRPRTAARPAKVAAKPSAEYNPFDESSVPQQEEAKPEKPREPQNFWTTSVFRPVGSESFKETSDKYLTALREQLPESLRGNYAVGLAEEAAKLPAEMFEFITSPAGIALAAINGSRYTAIGKYTAPVAAAVDVGFGLQQGAQAITGGVQIAMGDHSPARVVETISAAAFGAAGVTAGKKVWGKTSTYGPDLTERTERKQQIIAETDLSKIKDDPNRAISKFLTMAPETRGEKIRAWIYQNGPRSVAAMANIRRTQLGEIAMDVQRDRLEYLKVAEQNRNYTAAQLRRIVPADELKIDKMGYAIQGSISESELSPAARKGLGIHREFQRNEVARLKEAHGEEIELQDADAYINQAWDMDDLARQVAGRKGRPVDQDWVTRSATRGILRDRNLTRRVIPDYRTGMEEGIEIDGENYKLKPRYDNIVDVMKARDEVLSNAIANKRLADVVRSMAGILSEDEAEQLGVRSFYKKAPEATALYKATYAGTTKAGEVIRERRPIYVHPDLEMLVKAVFDKPYTTGKPWLIRLERARSGQKRMAFNLSFFHPGAISEQAQAANVFAQSPLKTIGQFWFLNPEYRKGWANSLWRVAHKEGVPPYDPPALRPDMQGPFLEMVEHGVQLMTRGQREAVLGWIKDKSPEMAHGSLQKAAQIAHITEEPLWDFYNQSVQVATWNNLVDAELKALEKRNPNPTALQIKEVKRTVADFINNAYGSINMEALLMDPRARYWTQMLVLAPSWTMSNLRTPLMIFENATGTRLASRWAMGAAFTWFLTLQTMNYAMTKWYNAPDKNGKTGGHFTWDNPGPPMTSLGQVGMRAVPNVNALRIYVGKNAESGAEEYITLGKNFVEPAKLFIDPARYLGSKSGSIIEQAAVQATGYAPGTGYKEIDTSHGSWNRKSLVQRIAALTGIYIPISLRPVLQSGEHALAPGIFPKPNLSASPLGYPIGHGATKPQLVAALKLAMEAGDQEVIQQLAVVARMNNIPFKGANSVWQQYRREETAERKQIGGHHVTSGAFGGNLGGEEPPAAREVNPFE